MVMCGLVTLVIISVFVSSCLPSDATIGWVANSSFVQWIDAWFWIWVEILWFMFKLVVVLLCFGSVVLLAWFGETHK